MLLLWLNGITNECRLSLKFYQMLLHVRHPVPMDGVRSGGMEPVHKECGSSDGIRLLLGKIGTVIQPLGMELIHSLIHSTNLSGDSLSARLWRRL